MLGVFVMPGAQMCPSSGQPQISSVFVDEREIIESGQQTGRRLVAAVDLQTMYGDPNGAPPFRDQMFANDVLTKEAARHGH